MKRVYETRAERGNNIDAWEYQVVAANGVEAARKALSQAKKDSGVKGGWRIVRVQERDGYVIT